MISHNSIYWPMPENLYRKVTVLRTFVKNNLYKSIVQPRRSFTNTSTIMSSQPFNPESLHNPYFYHKPGQKDIWSLINETAAQVQEESGKPVVNLGQGFFSYSPPDFAINAVDDALSKPQFNQYAHARGNPNLINEVAKHYSKAFGREVPASEVQITTGANEGMFSVFFGFLTPGDEAIVFEPFFDQYIPNIEMTGAKVKYVQLKYPEQFDKKSVSGDDWTIDWEALEKAITPKTKMIVINTPHNPIGKVFTEEELIRLGKIVLENNILLVSDEVYENLFFTPTFPRPANLAKLPELASRTFTIGSAGKSFAATGWRIGYVHAPASLLKYVTAAHTRICFSTPAPLQQAVSQGFIEAYKQEYFEKTKKQYIKKYEILTAVFDELNLPYTSAQGGYFLLVNLAKLKIPEDYKYPEPIGSKTYDFKLAYWLIKELGVVGIPPTEFLVPAHREGHGLEKCLRFAVCKDDAILEDAVKRLQGLKDYL